eukprot:1607704-Pyramimonas_sp.AAC.2
MSPDGYPARAVYGGLSGVQQTIGAAERHCVLQALRHFPGVKLLVTDLSALVTEGNRWGEYDELAGARHAGIWRSIRNFAQAREAVPPTFGWCPSHLDLDDVAAGVAKREANFDWVLGNAWADHFAKLGAKDIGCAEGYCD